MAEQNAESNNNNVSNRILYLISINHATNDASVALLPTLFPVILVLFNISLFELGILVAAMYITNVICQPITGLYSEKIEPRILLPLGIGIIGASMILLIFSTDFEVLLFSSILLRIGSSFFHPVGISTVSRSYSGEKLDRSMGFQSAFGNFGIFIVFLVGAPIYFRFGWSAPFLIFAVLDAAIVIVTFTKLGPVTAGSAIARRENQQDQEGSRRKKVLVSLPLFFLASTAISGASNAVVLNYGNILLEGRGFAVPQANLFIAVWIGFSFAGAFTSGALAKRFTRHKVLIIAYIVSSGSIFIFTLLAGNPILSLLSLAINGFAIAVTYPTIYSELSWFLGPKSDKKGSAYGMIFSSQIIGSAIMGFFAGYISGIFGLGFAFQVATVLLVIAAVVSLSWKRRENSNLALEKNAKIL